jgi:hypothetical protein
MLIIVNFKRDFIKIDFFLKKILAKSDIINNVNLNFADLFIYLLVYLVPLYCEYIKLVLCYLINYQKKIMLDLKTKNHLESTVDSKYTKLSLLNSLDVDNCLFTPELLAVLLRSYKDQSTYFKHASNKHSKVFNQREGIYLIAFRILNQEKKSIVYNYIYYNDMLYLTLIVYFLVRNYFITKNNHE